MRSCFKHSSYGNFEKLSGERGIRTLGTLTGTPVFKTGAFNRSAISPSGRESRCASREQQGIACVSRVFRVRCCADEFSPRDSEDAPKGTVRHCWAALSGKQTGKTFSLPPEVASVSFSTVGRATVSRVSPLASVPVARKTACWGWGGFSIPSRGSFSTASARSNRSA